MTHTMSHKANHTANRPPLGSRPTHPNRRPKRFSRSSGWSDWLARRRSARHRRGPTLLLAALATSVLTTGCPAPVVIDDPVPLAEDDSLSLEELVEMHQQALTLLDSPEPNRRLAADLFRQILEAEPELWEVRLNLGTLYAESGDWELAMDTYQDALGDGQDAVVHLAVGLLAARAGRHEEALRSFVQVVELDPGNLDAMANLALAQIEVGSMSEARQTVVEMLERDQNNVNALSLLGRIFHDQGDRILAQYLWEKVLSLDPTHAYTLNEMGRLVATLGEQGQAMRLFGRAAEGDPVAPNINRGAILLAHLEYEGAEIAFQTALRHQPRDMVAQLGLAASLYGQGQVPEAVIEYTTVLNADPENLTALRRLGDLAFEALNDDVGAAVWYGRHLEVRGLTLDSCSAESDDVCAAAQLLNQP